MKLTTARNLLSILWLGGALVFLLLLFLQTPQFGADAGDVWKQAPALWAPIVALVVAFLFGSHSLSTGQIPNPVSFYAALGISLVHCAAIYVGLFVWQNPMLDNLKLASTPLGYFSALTIAALNYFFIGVAKPNGPPDDPQNKGGSVPPGASKP